jgi:hypothetical protein
MVLAINGIFSKPEHLRAEVARPVLEAAKTQLSETGGNCWLGATDTSSQVRAR